MTGPVHDDVIKWKHFPRNWPFLRGIHRSPVNSPHKGQWRGALVFSLICVWINGWVNTREAGDLRRYRAHYDVTMMHTFHWQVEHATKYKHNLVRRLWKLCYGAEYAKPENAPTITLSREKEMIMMGDLNPIMYRWGGWRGKVTRNFERRSSPQSHMIDHGHDNNATNIELVEMNYHCSA